MQHSGAEEQAQVPARRRRIVVGIAAGACLLGLAGTGGLILTYGHDSAPSGAPADLSSPTPPAPAPSFPASPSPSESVLPQEPSPTASAVEDASPTGAPSSPAPPAPTPPAAGRATAAQGRASAAPTNSPAAAKPSPRASAKAARICRTAGQFRPGPSRRCRRGRPTARPDTSRRPGTDPATPSVR